MFMELYAKGQLSFLILTCMQDRDFYGLDIISEISSRSNGRINLKKPSVYSNLTRMEKQGYISSYLKSSDFGPNRKYYSLTEQGRAFYSELKSYFERNNIDVFKDFNDGESSPAQNISFLSEQPPANDELNIQKDTVIEEVSEKQEDEDDFFDFSSVENDNNQQKEEFVEEQAVEEDLKTENEVIKEEFSEESHKTEEAISDPINTTRQDQYSLRTLLQHNEEKEETVEKKNGELYESEDTKDDAVFLTQQNADEYNKRIYDISKDINKYKRKRSFAEDQISMNTAEPLVASQEKTKTSIEDFKNAILVNKNRYQDQRLNEEQFAKQMNYRFDRTAPVEKEEVKNDAVYITNRIEPSQVEKAKKIEPPRLKIISENVRENKLPAPKRDTSIDPSHREILTQLYSRTRDNTSTEVREDAIYDYNDLKDYYSNQNIAFSVYKKPVAKIKHNTNKLYMIVSLISFLVTSLLSAATFVTLYKAGVINGKTDFLYILLPALLVIDLTIKIYNYKKCSGWMPAKILPQWAIWLLFIAISGAIVGINFACGMSGANFALYGNTVILPIIMTFAVIPFRYYLNRLVLVKYWK